MLNGEQERENAFEHATIVFVFLYDWLIRWQDAEEETMAKYAGNENRLLL